ncbi:uncharacterized protein [Periplaneta americana]|uniref:uncharacterized protein n=1 Tax=Periplaneta americana TaxID=6978 RepID=UPI0037E98364
MATKSESKLKPIKPLRTVITNKESDDSDLSDFSLLSDVEEITRNEALVAVPRLACEFDYLKTEYTERKSSSSSEIDADSSGSSIRKNSFLRRRRPRRRRRRRPIDSSSSSCNSTTSSIKTLLVCLDGVLDEEWSDKSYCSCSEDIGGPDITLKFRNCRLYHSDSCLYDILKSPLDEEEFYDSLKQKGMAK